MAENKTKVIPEPTLHLSAALLWDLQDRAARAGEFFIGGFLHGICVEQVGERGYHTFVHGPIPWDPVYFENGHPTMRDIAQTAGRELGPILLNRDPGDQPLLMGWWHVHNGETVAPHPSDIAFHRKMFGQPWEVCLVLEPGKPGVGAYRMNAAEKFIAFQKVELTGK